MNNCEFHEQCEKCVGAKITKKKFSHCVYGNDDCKKCKQCFLEENNGVCDRKDCINNEPIETFEQVYEIDGVSPNNTLFVIEKLFLSNGWSLQSSAEAKELLRPLIIYLDRHKEKCEKEHFKKGMEFGERISFTSNEINNSKIQ